MDKKEMHHRLTQPEAFRAGQRSGVHMTLKLAGKLAFRITLVIALAVGVLAVVS